MYCLSSSSSQLRRLGRDPPVVPCPGQPPSRLGGTPRAEQVRFTRDQGLIDADLVDETTGKGLASLFAAGDYPDV